MDQSDVERAKPSSPAARRFATTRWTMVLAARGQSELSKQMLSELCTSYYEPVHAFVARYTGDMQQSRDLTHDFFAYLLEGNRLGKLEPGKGKFRSYLLGAVKHFLHDQADKIQAQKRGGQVQTVSLDAGGQKGEEGDNKESPNSHEPKGVIDDAVFDREWAISVLNQSLDLLRQGAIEHGQHAQFRLLSPFLTQPFPEGMSQQLASELGVSPESLAVMLHRLRRRFRDLTIEIVSSTLVDGQNVDEELDYLIHVLGTTSG